MPAIAARELLEACGLPQAEAGRILAHLLAVRRERLIAHPDTPVDPAARQRFLELAGLRAGGTPMAYVLQEQEFYGHTLRVTPDVLIPRPDTEVLVEAALAHLAGRTGARVLELGTGSGCIAIALALARRDLEVTATDRSEQALQVAAGNAQRLGARLSLLRADWMAPVQGRFDLIVANPPYVAATDPHLPGLVEHEPVAALTDGADGLQDLRTIIGQAPARMAGGALLLLEHGYDQGKAVRELLIGGGLVQVRTLRDLAGRERAGAGYMG